MTVTTVDYNSRITWIDALRALAMFIVVLVHASNKPIAGWWIYNVFFGPIMIPLFFTISGYLFNNKEGNQQVFYKGILNRLIIPWLFLSLIWVRLLFIPLKGIRWWLEYVEKVITGEKLWFIPTLIIVEIILFYVLNSCKKYRTIYLSLCICVVIGFLVDYVVRNFIVSTALICEMYIMFGLIMKNNWDRIKKCNWYFVILVALVYIGLGILSITCYPMEYMDVHLNQYPNKLICIVMSFIGCYLCFVLGSRIKNVSKLVKFVGANTFVCYALHGDILVVLNKLLLVFGIELQESWIGAIIQSILAMLICVFNCTNCKYHFARGCGEKT